MPSSVLGLFLNVELSDKFIGVPTLLKTRNDLDAHGSFLDLPRLSEETEDSYFKRLQSVIPLRGGSNEEGLTHGITRELGLEEKVGLVINPIASANGWAAPSPCIVINATSLILYSDYENGTIDSTIDIFGHGLAYTLTELVTRIQLSQYFVAELGPYVTGEERSFGLMSGQSLVTINNEWVPPSTYFHLQNTDVIPGTLSFTENSAFGKEVTPIRAVNPTAGITFAMSVNGPVSSEGEYYIDYTNGIVLAHTAPTGRGTCRYQYRDFPWRAKWSPIRIYSLRDEDYKEKVFEDEEMPDGTTRHGLVTAEGREVYTQIFNKVPSLWGI